MPYCQLKCSALLWLREEIRNEGGMGRCRHSGASQLPSQPLCAHEEAESKESFHAVQLLQVFKEVAFKVMIISAVRLPAKISVLYKHVRPALESIPTNDLQGNHI